MITKNGKIQNHGEFGVSDLSVAFDELCQRMDHLEVFMNDLNKFCSQKMIEDTRIFLDASDNEEIDSLLQAFSYAHGLKVRDAFFFLAGLNAMRSYEPMDHM